MVNNSFEKWHADELKTPQVTLQLQYTLMSN